jgi:hypothetical protein
MLDIVISAEKIAKTEKYVPPDPQNEEQPMTFFSFESLVTLDIKN